MQYSQKQLLANVLRNTRFHSVTHVDETGSTNNDLLAQLSSGEANVGDVLVADRQRDGKGRNQRSWLGYKGAALLVSIACELPAELASLTPIATGLAVVDAVDEVTTASTVNLKWPNDVLATCDNRKLTGILVESLYAGPHARKTPLVIGIGLNLQWDKPPEGLAEIAITLEQLAGRNIDRNDILGRVLKKLDERLTQLEQNTKTMLAAYRSRCLTLGQPVTRAANQGTISGIAKDITTQGELLVELESGTIVRVSAGDVIHLQ